MTVSAFTLVRIKSPMATRPGQFLKTVRERLQVGLKDVEEASAVIASEEANDNFYVSASGLSQIENELSMPSVFKLFTLSSIYGLDLHELLGKYGVDADRTHAYETRFLPETTRPLSAEIHGSADKVMIPVRLDPTFRWDNTQLINRAVALWGEIPATFLLRTNPRRHTYGFIGTTDRTMFPLLRPGSLVMIDPEKRRVQAGGWSNEFERPIYFLELRQGYRCGWCQVDGARLMVIPHTMSDLPVESFSLASEVDVLGQVVGVAMRLTSPRASTSETEPILPKPREFEK